MRKQNSGFITLAFGRKFAEMAIDTALSLREFHTEPISIAVDRAAERHLARYKHHPFDQIVRLPQRVHPFGARFLLAEASPYETTVSIDADILFVGRLPIFDNNFTAPLAMYGGYMGRDQDFQTYYSGRQICADFGLDRYYWGTGGTFLFRNPEALPMFRECYNFYVSGIKKYRKYAGGTLSDEMVFGIMGDKYPIDSIPCQTMHPWPRREHMESISPADSCWPVYHAFVMPNEPYWEFLMHNLNRRRREAGFATGSEFLWRQKAEARPTTWDKLLHVHRKFWRKFGIG